MTVSVVVYGRNDGHGYNMHKRVSISLNCMAEVLTDESDEIIFVDWNTPDQLPTLMEDIFDTLTRRCQNLLKIFRVRHSIHQELLPRDSNRPTIEPYARNVGIRRSNPSNQWVLNTNTDMVFLTPSRDLSSVLTDLTGDFYGAYRYELPEYLWNSQSRSAPGEFLNSIRYWTDSSNLKRKIYLDRGNHFLPDGPGDFQLVKRDAIFAIRGYPESMKYGWHVDSAFNDLLAREVGKPLEILQDSQIMSFHCNHLRSLTHFHTSNEKQNIYLPGSYVEQSELDWGLWRHDIEEIDVLRLNTKIHQVVESFGFVEENSPENADDIINAITYPQNTTLVFLTDLLVTRPKSSSVIYIGFNEEMRINIKSVCEKFDIAFEFYDVVSFDELVKFQFSRSVLVILDVGISSKKLLMVEALNLKKLALKQLSSFIEDLPKLAAKLRAECDNGFIAVVGPLNWASRLLVSNDFEVPLFNNYSQILSGPVRKIPQAEITTKAHKKILQIELHRHFRLSPSQSPSNHLLGYIVRFIPVRLKRILKPIVNIMFKSIQRMR